MSTATPSEQGTEAKLPSSVSGALDSSGGIEILPSSPSAASKSLRPENAETQFPKPSSLGAQVDVLIPSEPTADPSLTETQTFALDDTVVDVPFPLETSIATRQPPVAKTVLSPDGTVTLEPPVAGGIVYLAAKRTLDIVLSTCMLILLSPVLLLSALLVKLTDGGSIFYRHTRVGEGGNEFTCYKFRSMVVNAEKMKANLAFFNSHEDHRTFKIPDDPRVTRIGRWMRRTSVDELPQLWNVLKGDMSIVGPRPPVVSEVEQYTWDDMQRLAVKPGLTCIWQVSGRSRLPFPEQLKLDLEYIENRSLALDLKLIVLTVPAVLSADGAY